MARADFRRLSRSLDVSKGNLSVSHASSLTCQYETVVEGAKVKSALYSHDVTMQNEIWWPLQWADKGNGR